MIRLGLCVLAGLVGAAILHIAIIFGVPFFARHDAYSRARELGPPGRFHTVPRSGDRTVFPNRDPMMAAAICVFSLEDGPIRVTAEGDMIFWSASVYDAASNEEYSLNDRAAIADRLDLTIADPVQMLELRKALPPELAQSVLVESAADRGFIVLRVFSPDETWSLVTEAFLDSATCGPLATS